MEEKQNKIGHLLKVFAPGGGEPCRLLARPESNYQSRTKGILNLAGASSPIENELGWIEGA